MKKPFSFLFLLLAGLVVLLTASCNNDSDPAPSEVMEEPEPDPPPVTPTTFDREAMLQNIGEAVLIPFHEAFVAEVASLDSVAAVFASDPTEANLMAIQAQWLDTKKSWKQCEVFEILDVKDNFLHNRIDKWPTNQNFLNRNVSGTDELTEAFVEGSGSTSKGLPALEFLLFTEVGLTDFTSDSLATRRLTYIKAMTENLAVRSANLLEVWQNGLPEFISGTENFSKGSLNQLLNSQVGLLEEIINNKLGKPLGKNNGGRIQPDEAEAFTSQLSLPLIEENLKGLKASYEGDISKEGLDDLLDFLEAKQEDTDLSEAISSQFDMCFEKLALISEPLSIAVDSQNQAVEDLYQSVRDLLASFKVDAANNLGILITFNDTDGD